MPGQLNYPFLHKWFSSDGISVIGHAWHNDVLLEYEALAEIFNAVSSRHSLKHVLNSLNGFFAVVIETASFKAAAVDHIRSFPLIYREMPRGFEILSDFAWKEDYHLNKLAAGIFHESWCALGNNTLVEGCEQLEAGQFLWCDTGGLVDRDNYCMQYRVKLSDASQEELTKKGIEVFESVFRRLISELNGRPAVVPLSGGYDSRLILAMLVRTGYKNISAYTYGDPGSHEAVIAKKVAESLRVPWHFVEYDETVFNTFFSEEWNNYSKANHFLTSLPHEQDFFALYQLRSMGLLPAGFVALPGFCGDVLGGSVTAYRPFAWTNKALKQLIERKHLGNRRLPADSNETLVHDRTSFYDAYQQWYVCNKESKFIVNAVRVFEHFGGHWAMPFWDKELVDFWYAVPYDLREHQQLYNDILFSEFFKPMGIDIRKPAYDDNYPDRLKERLKDHLPDSARKLWKKLKPGPESDVNRLGVLNKMIIRKLDAAGHEGEKEVNCSHALYFLKNLNK